MATSDFRFDYPVPGGRTVLQGHANACAEYGHAYYVIDGRDARFCPRCGAQVTVPAPASAYDELVSEEEANLYNVYAEVHGVGPCVVATIVCIDQVTADAQACRIAAARGYVAGWAEWVVTL